ncbi:MAG TPA: hypothetical protein VLB84_03370, partial [Bacteroidia bacterium]|nr:hypothetical protein [Bacteroidia bacterium]
IRYFQKFKSNLLDGIDYYWRTLPSIAHHVKEKNMDLISEELKEFRVYLEGLVIPEVSKVIIH